MRYLVTGATGYVGGAVARQLTEAGHQVVALVRDPQRAAELTTLGASLAVGDITDAATLRPPMQGIDGLFHIAGWYKVGVRDKAPATALNIDGTRNVLEVMQELGVSKGVYTSSLAVNSDTGGELVDESYRFEGRHLSEYDRTKAVAHDIAERFIEDGLPLVIVQPGVIYGPGDVGPLHDGWEAYLKRQLPVVPRHTGYCFGHIEDTARAHLLAMERGNPGESYHICGPAHPVSEAFELAAEISGVPPPRTVPAWPIKAVIPLISLLERIVALPPNYTSEYLRSSSGVTYFGSNAKARQELGFEPRPLRDGLPETIRDEMRRLGTAPASQ